MNTQPKHTPGPWFTDANNWHSVMAGVKGRGIQVARTNVSTHSTAEEQQANARLIAAAPDLLSALEWALDHLAEPLHDWSQYSEEYNIARAAIAKAKGG